MQVSVESPSKLTRRLTVTVPFETLEAAFDKRIKKLSQTAKVNGYRTGNVPLARIKELYGSSARQQAMSEVIESSLYAAISQEKLNPVSPPTIEPKSIAEGQPLEFIATFDVLPEIEGVNFAVTTLDKDIATITEADVDRVIERLSEQHITWREVTRGAQEKDQVVTDFRGEIDGKVFPGGEAHDYPIIIGSKTMIPGFEEGLTGIKAGEEKTLKITFPADYFAKEVAGKEAVFTVKAIKVSEPEFPAMDADLVRKFGIASGEVSALRSEIKKNLDREVERIIQTKLKSKVFDLLLAQNPLEVPDALIAQESKRIHNEMHPHHGKDEHNHSDEEMKTFNDAAKRNVVLGMLIGEYIKKENLQPDKTRVHQHIQKLASAYEKPEEVVQWYTSDKRRLSEIEMLILEEQVIEKLLESVKITEKTLNYSDLINS
jgi:trigger factor